MDQALERLAEQLAQGHTQAFLDLLNYYAQFHRYSAQNCVLIKAQRPDASRVAGYRAWQKLGRQVKKDSKGIFIWAPVIIKGRNPDTGEEEEHCIGFRPAAVFAAEDLVDIDTNPLPSLWQPLPDDCGRLYAHCVERIEEHGIEVREEPLPLGIGGVSRCGVIAISTRLTDSRNQLFTLTHELVHELAHQIPDRERVERGQAEFEAEATSYVVAAVLGLEHPTARDYLISWKTTAETLKASLGVIQHLTRSALRILKVEDVQGTLPSASTSS